MSAAWKLRPNADWVELLEVFYSPAADDHTWGTRVVDLWQRVLGVRARVNLSAIRHDPECTVFAPALLVNIPSAIDVKTSSEIFKKLGTRFFKTLWYPPTPVALITEILARMDHIGRAAIGGFQSAGFTPAEGVGLCMQPEPGLALVLGVPTDTAVDLGAHERRLLVRIALHLETAYRLRLRPEVVKAVLSPEGKILHREHGAVADAAMQQHVARIEDARKRRSRHAPESVELWKALVEGRASVVERREGSRRQYVFVENAPASRSLRALSAGELQALSLATRGVPAKLSAYALGVSEPVISNRLATAAAKIGLATRTELVRLAAILVRDPRVDLDDAKLTMVEREILELLLHGLSNKEIAATRNRSVHTIANQVADLLRKTGSPTRRALVARAR